MLNIFSSRYHIFETSKCCVGLILFAVELVKGDKTHVEPGVLVQPFESAYVILPPWKYLLCTSGHFFLFYVTCAIQYWLRTWTVNRI